MSVPRPPDALRDALRNLPAAAFSLDPDALGPLHEVVCALVDELKTAGMAPEHVVLTVKGIVYDAGPGFAGSRLIDTMVRWCLQRYFPESTDS